MGSTLYTPQSTLPKFQMGIIWQIWSQKTSLPVSAQTGLPAEQVASHHLSCLQKDHLPPLGVSAIKLKKWVNAKNASLPLWQTFGTHCSEIWWKVSKCQSPLLRMWLAINFDRCKEKNDLLEINLTFKKPPVWVFTYTPMLFRKGVFFKIFFLSFFIYFWLLRSLVAAPWIFSSYGERGLLWFWCWLLTMVASLAAEQGSRVLGLQQLWPMGLAALHHMESSNTRDQTCLPCIGRWILNH